MPTPKNGAVRQIDFQIFGIARGNEITAGLFALCVSVSVANDLLRKSHAVAKGDRTLVSLALQSVICHLSSVMRMSLRRIRF
jgi:hypothetical protein